MAILKNRAGVSTTTTGTGTVTLGAAIPSGAAPFACSWQTFSAAGAVDGDTVRYLILDTNGAWEYGPGLLGSSGTTITRPGTAMNGSVAGQRSSTGSLLSLSGIAQVFITSVAEDLVTPSPGATDNALVRFDGASGQLIQNSTVFVDDSGRLSMGVAAQTTAWAAGLTPNLQVLGTTNDTSEVAVGAFAANNTTIPIIHLSKSRGAAVGTYTVVSPGDVLGTIGFLGADGANLEYAAQIVGEAGSNVDGGTNVPANDIMGGRLKFLTTRDNTKDLYERIRIDSQGFIVLGSSQGDQVGSNTSPFGTQRSKWDHNAGLTPRLAAIGTTTSRSSMACATFDSLGGAVSVASLWLSRSRGSTVGDYTIVQNGDQLGEIAFFGSDGATLEYGAQIWSSVEGAPADNKIPAMISFRTNDVGDEIPSERVRIKAEGTLATFRRIEEPSVALADGATVALDAKLGNLFHLTAAGDRTILVPTNAPASGRTQKIVIRHEASGANRTLSLTTGSAGSFRFGTTITGLTLTVSGTIDYIGCIWNQAASRWDVVSYSKGF